MTPAAAPDPGPSEPSRPPELGHAVLRRARGHHAFEGCVEQLATAIRLGVYPRGTTLPPERELASLLGVSRATLREAMAALREAGLVETRRGRGGGTVVTLRPPTPSARAAARLAPERRAAWLDALDFRRVVEPGAAELAATRGEDLSEAEREGLRTALEDVSDAPDAGRHRQADSRLHLTLAALSGSPRLIEAVTESQAVLHEMLSAIPVLPTNIAHSHAQHERIVASVLDSRPERARAAMLEHCDDTSALLRGLIG